MVRMMRASTQWTLRIRLSLYTPSKIDSVIPRHPLETQSYLEDAFERAEPGTVYLVNRYRDTNQNLRTQLQRICKRAGVEPGGKLFHNLRASRETELGAEYRSMSLVSGSAIPR